MYIYTMYIYSICYNFCKIVDLSYGYLTVILRLSYGLGIILYGN